MKYERGFTLLELMVAMSIFAMLAVAGWQVFDGVNRARERAQYQADNLALLQYAYLQLQQDMGQIIPYQIPSIENNNNALTSNPNNQNSNAQANNVQTNNAQTNSVQVSPAEPFMSVSTETISFIRFADPDPRYQSSPTIVRVDYVFADQQLIRRQYLSPQGDSIDDNFEGISLDSVILKDVSDGRMQAYLPEPSSTFPQDNPNTNTNMDTAATAQNPLLPNGVGMSFTYQDVPITWQFALSEP